MKYLSQLWEFLQGKKTYLSALFGSVIGSLYLFHYITPQQFQALAMVASSFGLVGLRSAMAKFEMPLIVNQHIDMTKDSENLMVADATGPVTGSTTTNSIG